MRFLIAVVAVAVVVAGVVIVGTFSSSTPVAMAAGTCQASLGDWKTDGAAGQGAADAAKLGDESRQIVGAIIDIGKQRNLPPRAWQVAIQAGMTESGLRNLKYGDRDSLGIFQMRPSMNWGSADEVTNVQYAINKFYTVLLTVPGWDQIRPGDAAQAVERSGFPDRYHKWEPMAAWLISQAGVEDPTGCAGGAAGASQAAQTAIDAAMSKLGSRYVWGAAGENDTFDCSGLMLWAYRKAGITLPRVADAQYRAGAHYPVEQAQPGDLVFWADATGDPAAIHHVGMYLGDNKVVHAPDVGDVVKVSAVWQHELVRTVTRPGVSS
ncbi:C40 family peptidase [Amycolatopsis sp. NPDC058986]|uniref:C40 family peptidase n=1 Tax=unclassified Amycolatopsis TaxID=2618356 RepID=UPI00366A8351